jgi:hypothetical protein
MNPAFPRARYAPCDSYFIESDEISMAERLRERERAVAKMRQRELGIELSHLTSDDYLEDILDHMEHMEVSFNIASHGVGAYANHCVSNRARQCLM